MYVGKNTSHDGTRNTKKLVSILHKACRNERIRLLINVKKTYLRVSVSSACYNCIKSYFFACPMKSYNSAKCPIKSYILNISTLS